LQVGVLNWFARLWEIDEQEYWGYITNCGTEGNLHGILVGRENHPDGILYASRATHYSVFKAARMYRMDAEKVRGLGREESAAAVHAQSLGRNGMRHGTVMPVVGAYMSCCACAKGSLQCRGECDAVALWVALHGCIQPWFAGAFSLSAAGLYDLGIHCSASLRMFLVCQAAAAEPALETLSCRPASIDSLLPFFIMCYWECQVSTLESGEIDYDDLKARLAANNSRPAIINVNIGTTVKGAVDDLDRVLDILTETGYTEDRCEGLEFVVWVWQLAALAGVSS
jgi:hypothetical protein